MFRRLILLCLLLGTLASLDAQEITFKSIVLLPDDATAQDSPVLDNRQRPCALVKIKAEKLKGLEFPRKNQYKKALYHEQDGLYYVYIPQGAHKLEFSHADYVPGVIELKELWDGTLESGKTYLMELNVPTLMAVGTIVVLKVTGPSGNPVAANVTFDGKQLPTSSNGIYEVPVEPGTHNYAIQADDLQPMQGSLSVEKGESKTVKKRLKYILHGVLVDCKPSDALVFVDNVNYGKAGKLNLPQGRHNIRIQAEDYLNAEEDIDITAETGVLSYTLKKNKNVKEIHAVPVTIYSLSKSPKIYKNNYEIIGWKNGSVVKFMPGKYLLSDDYRNEYKLVVKEGASPMTLKF